MQLPQLVALLEKHIPAASMDGQALGEVLSVTRVVSIPEIDAPFNAPRWASSQPPSTWENFRLPNPRVGFMADNAMVVLWDHEDDAVGLTTPRGAILARWLDGPAAAQLRRYATRVPHIASQNLEGLGLIGWSKFSNGQVSAQGVVFDSIPGGLLLGTQDNALICEPDLSGFARSHPSTLSPDDHYAVGLVRETAQIAHFSLLYLAYVDTLDDSGS